MRKYLLVSCGISVLLLILFYLDQGLLVYGYLHQQFPALILFFFLQSLAISVMLYKGQKSGWKSPSYALGMVTFRFLTGLLFLTVLMINKVENLTALMIQFLAIYLIYLIFELFIVLANLRRN